MSMCPPIVQCAVCSVSVWKAGWLVMPGPPLAVPRQPRQNINKLWRRAAALHLVTAVTSQARLGKQNPAASDVTGWRFNILFKVIGSLCAELGVDMNIKLFRIRPNISSMSSFILARTIIHFLHLSFCYPHCGLSWTVEREIDRKRNKSACLAVFWPRYRL